MRRLKDRSMRQGAVIMLNRKVSGAAFCDKYLNPNPTYQQAGCWLFCWQSRARITPILRPTSSAWRPRPPASPRRSVGGRCEYPATATSKGARSIQINHQRQRPRAALITNERDAVFWRLTIGQAWRLPYNGGICCLIFLGE